MSGQPTVTVRFPDGDREWPAHYEQEDDPMVGRSFDTGIRMSRLVPDYRDGYEFREIIGLGPQRHGFRVLCS